MPVSYYTDQQTIEDYLKRSLTADEVAYLAVVLPAVDSFIDNYTGTDWAGTSPAYYDASRLKWLDVGRYATITSVQPITYDADGDEENDGDALVENVDYQAYPLNQDYTDRLYRLNQRWSGRVKITGTFASPPAAIVDAATKLAAGSLSSDSGDVKRESIEGYSREFFGSKEDAVDITNTLDQYRNIVV